MISDRHLSAVDAPALGQEAYEVPKAAEGDLELWSVTSILNSLSKEALIAWAANETAAAAVARAPSLAADVENQGAEEVYRQLAGARFRTKGRLTAADLGSVVHAACEEYALTGTRPNLERLGEMVHATGNGGRKVPTMDAGQVAAEAAVVATMLDRFDEWAHRFQPSYTAAEVVVYNLTFGYAGQVDAYLKVGDGHYVGDYKTSREPRDSRGNPKRPYPEASLQLAAYRHAERAAVWRPRRTKQYNRRVYLLSDAERDRAVPVPETDGALVIHITPEACEAFPVMSDRRAFDAFLFVEEVARWQHGIAKDAIANAPLV